MNQEEKPYRPFDTFVLRTPFFPYSFFDRLRTGSAIEQEFFWRTCLRPEVQEAIRIASPDLYADLDRRLGRDEADPKKIERLRQSMLRYLLRMSTRSTPFGLFAGFSTGHIGQSTEIELVPAEKYGRHTRLDMNYLCALGQELARIPELTESISYFPNSSIYQVGDQLRYVEYRYQNKRRMHHIIAVDHSDYLQRVLQAAKTGKKAAELAALLADEEITLDEAREFIGELIESQLLVNDLEPAVTGPEFLEQVIRVLEPVAAVDHIRSILQNVKTMLAEIDAKPIGTTVALYDKIEEELKNLKTEFDGKYLFQSDMVKPAAPCVLDGGICADVMTAFEVLNRISPRPRETALDRFRQAFYDRFETREVPLPLALDLECGIPYQPSESHGDDSPLIDGVGRQAAAEAGTGREITWNEWHSRLLQKMLAVRDKKAFELELRDEDFSSLPLNWDDLPDTLAAMVRVVSGKHGDEGKPRIYMAGLGGSGAANLLGRFCHADDELLSFVRRITAREQELNEKVLYAEIVHLPESRTGNILLRPVIRSHEIPYLARSAVGPDFQIRIADLLLSVRNNRLVLRSPHVDREIVPRLSTAHNYSFNSVPVYHFLCDLQHQGRRSGVGFNWGPLEGEFSFLPRVTYRNIIFSFARWRVMHQEIKKLYEEKNDQKLLKTARAWRKKRKMPPMVFLDDSDNELVIDLENIDCIKNLLAVTKKRAFFLLEEFLFDPDNAVVRCADEVYLNEFILSFERRQAISAAAPEADNESE